MQSRFSYSVDAGPSQKATVQSENESLLVDAIVQPSTNTYVDAGPSQKAFDESENESLLADAIVQPLRFQNFRI